MTRLISLRIGHAPGPSNYTPQFADGLGVTDTVTLARSVTLAESLGLTDSRTITSGAGLGLAPLGTSPLGG